MALDEVLAQCAIEPVLRLYRWTPATLSLGYFQRYEDRRSHEPSLHCPAVRRTSGGGAIVHDRELTYSLVIPGDKLTPRDARGLYASVHATLVLALQQLGVDATQHASVSAPATESEPFLCFRRRAVGDVVLAGHKIAGSAQRRWRGVVLEHGSILLAASPAAPELPGINDLTSRSIDETALRNAWLAALSARLNLHWRPDALTADEREQAAGRAAEKFAQNSWTLRH
ncbi:MAG TPA: hypothetical protein VHV77_05465 [Pirellulales bacterium]|nr:hypothetical protein [Pirellulales bacterium]